jgi:hypothetical protein
VTNVVSRVDDMLEITSYYIQTFGKPLPNSLKKGLSGAFNKFDNYQLAKYKASKSKLSLVDLVNLVHPIPNDSNSDSLSKLVKDQLKRTGTWEDKMTTVGQQAKTTEEKQEMKTQVWSELIKTRKLGYFALLKNLRNILTTSPTVVDDACAMLTDPKLIKKSMVLPFRFIVAYTELQSVQGSAKVLDAICKAAEISLSNVPKLPGKTLVALDISGSMESSNPTMKYQIIDIAAQFTTVLVKANQADLLVFNNTASYANIPSSADLMSSIQLLKQKVSGGTNFHAIFETLTTSYDRIVILSDMQAWMGTSTPVNTFNNYCKRVANRPKIYSFDLAGYGTLQFPENQVCALAGFSDKIFDIMKIVETDSKALIKKIKEIKL